MADWLRTKFQLKRLHWHWDKIRKVRQHDLKEHYPLIILASEAGGLAGAHWSAGIALSLPISWWAWFMKLGHYLCKACLTIRAYLCWSGVMVGKCMRETVFILREVNICSLGHRFLVWFSFARISQSILQFNDWGIDAERIISSFLQGFLGIHNRN